MQLAEFNKNNFDRGRVKCLEALWITIQGILFSTWIPGSKWRIVLLRMFGAKIGKGVVIKPKVKIKFPWKLLLGNYVWIGEGVWIDNLDYVAIESNVCISQGAYLCTGSHDWSKETFDLRLGKIKIEEGAWIAAKAVVAPGVTVGEGAVLSLGSVATKSLDVMGIYSGNPAVQVGKRQCADD